MTMKLSDFLTDVGRPVAFYPSLVKALGDRNEAIFICQMAYWRGKGETGDDWIYKTSEEIEQETSLTYKEQSGVRDGLIKKGLLEEHYARTEHKMYYRVVWDAVNAIWEHFTAGQVPPGKVPPSPKSSGSLPPVISLNSNTETTQKNTQGFRKFSQKSTDELREMVKLGERMEALIGLTPDFKNTKWTKTLRDIIHKEAAGQKFETYVKWLQSGNEYNRPKPFQMASNPKLILTTWGQAFLGNGKKESEYVPEPDYMAEARRRAERANA